MDKPRPADVERLLNAAAEYEANAAHWDSQYGQRAKVYADFQRKLAAELRARAEQA